MCDDILALKKFSHVSSNELCRRRFFPLFKFQALKGGEEGQAGRQAGGRGGRAFYRPRANGRRAAAPPLPRGRILTSDPTAPEHSTPAAAATDSHPHSTYTHTHTERERESLSFIDFQVCLWKEGDPGRDYQMAENSTNTKGYLEGERGAKD